MLMMTTRQVIEADGEWVCCIPAAALVLLHRFRRVSLNFQRQSQRHDEMRVYHDHD